MTRKEIGKIQSVSFGHGGYQDAMIGISFTLGSDKAGWGVGDFWGTWGMEPDKYTKWTKKDQVKILGETVLRINQLLSDAKVSDINKLQGIPVEVEFESNTLKSWRILTEVI